MNAQKFACGHSATRRLGEWHPKWRNKSKQQNNKNKKRRLSRRDFRTTGQLTHKRSTMNDVIIERGRAQFQPNRRLFFFYFNFVVRNVERREAHGVQHSSFKHFIRFFFTSLWRCAFFFYLPLGLSVNRFADCASRRRLTPVYGAPNAPSLLPLEI